MTGRDESPNDTREFDRFAPYVTVDCSLYAEPAQGLRINLSVTNLLGRVGQSYFGAIIPATINDPLGRRFALTVSRKW